MSVSTRSSTVLLLHGASSSPEYWARVRPALEAAGHRCVAPGLPIADPEATFHTYAEAAIAALPDAHADVVVAQSMGAFTAPLVASAVGARQIILVAPMIPAPGERPSEWGGALDLEAARQDMAAREGFPARFDPATLLMHDVPAAIRSELEAVGEPEQAPGIFQQPFPLETWPSITTHVIASTRDRLFPVSVIDRAARERLGVEPERLDCGHLAGFARPDHLAQTLLRLVPAHSSQ